MTLVTLIAVAVAGQLGWGPPVEWQDGATTRRAYESPVLVAELDGTDASARRLRELVPSAVLVAAQAKVRLWRLPDAETALAADELRLVPVLHDGPSTRAKQRVAVGGVLVTPRDGSPEGVRALASRLGGAPSGGAVLVSSGPGRAALEAAAALALRGDVASARPNWWSPARGK